MELSLGVLIGLGGLSVGLIWWCFRLEARQERIIETLNRIQHDSRTEHSALLTELKEGRREMAGLISEIKEPLIQAVTVLTMHVNEERRK